MAKLLKLRRGTTTQHGSFTGAEGEVTVDTSKDVLVVNDGSTAGGHPLAAEDMSNVSSASIAGRLGTDSIATTKIAAGNLPTDVVATAFKTNRAIVAEAIASSAVVDRTIANDAVTFAKMQNIGTPSFLGRNSSGTGDVENLSTSDVRTMLNVENGATGDQTAAEIRTLVESASDSNVFTDADHSKLNGIAASANNYSHPSNPGDDFDVDTGVLSGATVVSDIDINVTTDTLGHVTDANGSVSTRTLTLANLGYSGATNANYITNNNEITNGRGFTTYTSNQATNNNSNVTFGTVNCSSLTSSGDVTAFSDKRLKENIEVIPNALDKVKAINGVSFDWKKTGEKSAGVIAQEVQEVLPEAVKEVIPIGGGDSHLAVNYHALTSILIESIKELQARVQQLEGGK